MTPDQMTALQTRLERLKKEILLLEKNKPGNLEELLADEFKLHALERSLEVALEAVIDIGRLTIALRGLPKPETNTEIFDILAQHGALPKQFADTIRGIGGMRNILVHDYMDIDYKRIYTALENLADLKKFAEYIIKAIDE